MRHDPRLARLDVHPGWCDCRLCGPRKAGVEEDIRDTIRCAVAGLIVALPVCAAVLVIHFWPAIAAIAGDLL